jgi:hypothetical protein
MIVKMCGGNSQLIIIRVQLYQGADYHFKELNYISVLSYLVPRASSIISGLALATHSIGIPMLNPGHPPVRSWRSAFKMIITLSVILSSRCFYIE